MNTKLSMTMVALLNATKKQDIAKSFSYEFLANALIEPIGKGINIRNCLEIVINTLMEMRQDRRFEIPYGNSERNDLMFEIIFAPVSAFYGIEGKRGDDQTTLLYVYESMIVKCLNFIRMARVDWCKDQLNLD